MAVDHLAAAEDRVELVIWQTEPLVRPHDVLSGLTFVAPVFVPTEVPILTRINQGMQDAETAEIGDPFRR